MADTDADADADAGSSKMAELSRLLQGQISRKANLLSDDVIRSISPFIAALDQRESK